MDVDVLLWGGSHKFEAYEMEGKFFVSPGSATGAMGTGWWPDGEEPVPSFVLMDVSIGSSLRDEVVMVLIDCAGTRRCGGILRIPAQDRRERRRNSRSRKGILPERRQQSMNRQVNTACK